LCTNQKKREISSDDKFWNLRSFGGKGKFWKKVYIYIYRFNEWNVMGKFLEIGLEPRELHIWIASERRWSFRKVIRLCHDSKSKWQVWTCDLKIMALPYTYVRDAKVHYFIVGRRGRKEGRKEGRGKGFFAHLLPFLSRHDFAYPRATSCENDKVLHRLNAGEYDA